MNKIEEIKAKLRAMKSVKEVLLAELRETVRKKVIKCVKCGKGSRISDWTFIQEKFHLYTRLINTETEQCQLECPACGYWKRINKHPQSDKIVYWADTYPFNKDDLFGWVEIRED